MILSRWLSRKHQESVSHLDSIYTDRTCVIYLFWNPGVYWRLANSISALHLTEALHHPAPWPTALQVLQEQLAQLIGGRVGKRNLVLQLGAICALIWMWLLISEGQRGSWTLLLYLLRLLQASPPPAEYFKSQCPLPSSFFFLSPF